MKIAVLMVVLMAAFVGARGAPPASVANYAVTWVESDVSNLFNTTQTQVLLNPNGTTTGLLLTETREGSVGATLAGLLANVSIPSDGTWSYRVGSGDTAELVVNGRTLQLLFDETGFAGRITNFRSLLVPRFALRAYAGAGAVVNCATRAYVAPGRSVSFGFVLATGDRRVLVRAVGPGLRAFGLTEVLDQPVLDVRRTDNALPLTFTLPAPWFARETLEQAGRRAGAFPLPSAGDRGVFMRLGEGAYTVEVSGVDSRSAGEVLIEVYQLP